MKSSLLFILLFGWLHLPCHQVEQDASLAFPNLQFERMTDPFEQAFSVSMPKGWCSQVGLLRPYGQARPFGRAKTSQHQTELFFGDPIQPLFILPQDSLAPLADSIPWMKVRAFPTADSFAKAYVQEAFAKAASGWQSYSEEGMDWGKHLLWLETKEDDELLRITERQAANYPELSIEISTSVLRYAFTQWGDTLHGELNCSLVKHGNYWAAELSGFTTDGPPKAVRSILRKILWSMEVRPDWLRRHKKGDPSLISPYAPQSIRAAFGSGGWRYFWLDPQTGESRATEIRENPNPDKYVRWHEKEFCLGQWGR